MSDKATLLDIEKMFRLGRFVLHLVDKSAAISKVELAGRPYELVHVAGGRMFRTKAHFAEAIKAAADLGGHPTNFIETEMAVLCAIAYHQPICRAGLADIFGEEISRDLVGRL